MTISDRAFGDVVTAIYLAKLTAFVATLGLAMLGAR